MSATNHIQYWYDQTSHMELILCNNSIISYPLHNHVSVFTAGMLLSGSVFLTVDNHTVPCKAERLFIIPPYAAHIIKANQPYTLLTLCIHKHMFFQWDKEKIKAKILDLLDAVPDLHLTAFQKAQFIMIPDLIQEHSELHFSEPWINMIKDQIESFPEKPLSVEDMSQLAYISKFHFIRNFKNNIGLTPHQFQIQNRIRKAQRLLNYTGNITEVALTTGFCDQSHFTKHFEKYVGLTPTAYKASCRLVC